MDIYVGHRTSDQRKVWTYSSSIAIAEIMRSCCHVRVLMQSWRSPSFTLRVRRLEWRADCHEPFYHYFRFSSWHFWSQTLVITFRREPCVHAKQQGIPATRQMHLDNLVTSQALTIKLVTVVLSSPCGNLQSRTTEGWCWHFWCSQGAPKYYRCADAPVGVLMLMKMYKYYKQSDFETHR